MYENPNTCSYKGYYERFFTFTQKCQWLHLPSLNFEHKIIFEEIKVKPQDKNSNFATGIKASPVNGFTQWRKQNFY